MYIYTVVRGLRLDKTHQPLNWKYSMKRFQGPNPDRRVYGALRCSNSLRKGEGKCDDHREKVLSRPLRTESY